MPPSELLARVAILCIVGAALAASPCHAAPPKGSVKLRPSALFQLESAGLRYTCGRLPPWSHGRMVQGYFFPTKIEIAALKRRISSARTSKEKTKLRASLAALQAKLVIAKPLCAAGLSPTPTPVPTGNFDSQGNVTAAGKVQFQIPSEIQASAARGIGTWNLYCNGCHHSYPQSLPIRSYPGIRARIQESPMSFLVPEEISDQQIADITAFANY